MWKKIRRKAQRVTTVFLWQRLGITRRHPQPQPITWCPDRAPVSKCKMPGASPDRSIWCARSRQNSQRPTASGMCRWSQASGNTSRTTANPKRPTAIIKILAELSRQLPIASLKFGKVTIFADYSYFYWTLKRDSGDANAMVSIFVWSLMRLLSPTRFLVFVRRAWERLRMIPINIRWHWHTIVISFWKRKSTGSREIMVIGVGSISNEFCIMRNNIHIYLCQLLYIHIAQTLLIESVSVKN